MQTVLSQFCEEFERRVRPVLEPLDRFAASLGQTQDGTPARTVLLALLDLRHQVRALADKVERQQAYVIIFGPLKSGKSTLMNAMSAAYVSEVTTLPAYPCMVYVAHADKREFVLTRYDGSAETLNDVSTMRAAMRAAHGELAEAVRASEARGEEFDPAVHLPRAVRRVDVHTPAEQLAGSGAVLVDTPGLYSRMKFGYDLMTRECRDAAASAVFVVKTDNLFLEQVFDEFSELLRLFSRIFLVVNVDSTKQDLQPDGALGPSLECCDPKQIVEAFERLVMNAALKEAREDGRLEIYTIDLLRSASERLRGAGTSRTEHSAAARAMAAEGGEDATGSGSVEQEAGASGDFSRFLADLTDYLNSTDYLVAFLGDSLRQARGLMAELASLAAGEPVVALARQVEALEAEREQRVSRAAALARLGSFGWEDALAGLAADVERITAERGGAVRTAAGEQVDEALVRWFDGDASFASLLRDGLGGILGGYRDQVAAIAHEVTQTVLGSDVAAASVMREHREDFSRAKVDVVPVARRALAGAPAPEGKDTPRLDVPASAMQVKKTFLDRLLLRGQAAVRRRVLGPDATPDKPIPRRVKQKRLAAGRVIFGEVLRARFARFAAETNKESVSEAFALAAAEVAGAVRRAIDEARRENTQSLEQSEASLATLARARNDADAAVRAVEAAARAIDDLAGRYAETSPSLLLQAPVPGAGGAAQDTAGSAPARS